ncbi:MAG: DUF1877 family protein [Planctomycetaceae bacterium]|nr:DUF1877 family protein [Planctomycetales bacterium]MCB9875346.1 DUF1877 family protein [Planctomycetaceae bacterium]MCB9936696.1 DUF1877 family protein [Planctomycetaceae bacterium]
MSVESGLGRGAYIVLTREDAKELFSQEGDAAVRTVAERLRNSKKHIELDLVLECGTSWDPIHRALTDGTLNQDVEDFPLDHCVLGGKRLHEGKDFEAILIRPDIVPHVAAGMHDLKRAEFTERYMALDPAAYGKQPTEAEGDETWAMLKLIRQLFEDAGNEHAAVLFTVAR